MVAYFCVVRRGVREIGWFVSRNPEATLRQMTGGQVPAELVFFQEHPDSVSAYGQADAFDALDLRSRWRFIRSANHAMQAQAPPWLPVLTSGGVHLAGLKREQIVPALLDASQRGDTRLVRWLYQLLDSRSEGGGWDGPDGTVGATLHRGPRPRPDSRAECLPGHAFTHDVRGGASFSVVG